MSMAFADPMAAWADPGIVEKYLDHFDTFRGRVRETIPRRHLLQVVPGLDLGGHRIVDIGAGDARDASWLAGLGNDVLAVDPSEAMLARARRRVEAREDHGRLEIRQGDASTVLSAAGERSYGVVLSHGVAMYQADLASFLSDHMRLLAPYGYLSVITRNVSGAAQLSAANAARSLDDSQAVGNLGLTTNAHSVQDVSDSVVPLGGLVVSWAGLRVLADAADGEPANAADALDLEWRSCRSDPARNTAALLHIVVQRGVDLSRLPSS